MENNRREGFSWGYILFGIYKATQKQRDDHEKNIEELERKLQSSLIQVVKDHYRIKLSDERKGDWEIKLNSSDFPSDEQTYLSICKYFRDINIRIQQKRNNIPFEIEAHGTEFVKFFIAKKLIDKFIEEDFEVVGFLRDVDDLVGSGLKKRRRID